MEHRYHLTALHMAAKSGLVENLKSLIDAGADLLIQTSDNRTALGFAAYSGHVECVRLLLQSELMKSQKWLERTKEVGVSEIRKQQTLSPTKALLSMTPFGKLVLTLYEYVATSAFIYKSDQEINSKRLYNQRFLNAAFKLTIQAKIESVEIIRMLLCAGADANEYIDVDVDNTTSYWKSAGSLAFNGDTSGKVLARNKSRNPDSILKISPTCYAITAGHMDVALELVKAPGWRTMNIVQSLMCLLIAAVSGRFELGIYNFSLTYSTFRA
jgi:ankyrin repeat protein